MNVWAIGNTIAFVQALFVLMGADILGGIFIALKQKKLSSTTSWRGMGKKAMTFLVILVVAVMQQVTKFPPIVVFGWTMTMIEGAILFYLATEAISVLEKAAIMGVPLPRGLVETMIKLKGESGPALNIGVLPVPPKDLPKAD